MNTKSENIDYTYLEEGFIGAEPNQITSYFPNQGITLKGGEE